MRHIKDQAMPKIQVAEQKNSDWRAVNYANASTRLMSMEQLKAAANRMQRGAA
ncbi:hypothetical protein [Pseudoalteromonas obscura]|uniref:Uncharacterized protein n=1 Tax=Pseudoalteromonas obscura TaxID=3048491 RepID=A0ABT7EUA6_9GAMM|nr:hypothetical protein [Pseudoalteromonas sp. P94(2023)]MDK2598637.1 hypothetical protein [Pseudoalteromonas sp. P94(2023)]